MNLLWLLPVASCLSLLLAGLIRSYALSHDLIDVPNLRSSHSTPTPRGGGLAFIVPFLMFTPILGVFDDLPMAVIWAFLGGGIWISFVGFLDDRRHIAARWRLLAHFIGAVWVLFWLGGFPPVLIFGVTFDLAWLGNILAAVYLVWLLNLYNFMDGIDGIASIEAVTVCISVTILLILQDSPQSIWLTISLLAASVVGFLFWNFPPAKIFMGDVGSGFLGLILGMLSIQVAWILPHMFWVWIVLLGVFIVDATLTLIRRVIKGEKFYEAHKSHIYQITARRCSSHKAVSLIVGLINVLWLLPVAYLVVKEWVYGLEGVILAYIPLVGLFFYFGSKQNKLEV